MKNKETKPLLFGVVLVKNIFKTLPRKILVSIKYSLSTAFMIAKVLVQRWGRGQDYREKKMALVFKEFIIYWLRQCIMANEVTQKYTYLQGPNFHILPAYLRQLYLSVLQAFQGLIGKFNFLWILFTYNFLHFSKWHHSPDSQPRYPRQLGVILHSCFPQFPHYIHQ